MWWRQITFFLLYGLRYVIFSTLLANLKDPLQNRDRVPALWAELHIPSILLLYYLYFSDISEDSIARIPMKILRHSFKRSNSRIERYVSFFVVIN